MIWYQGLYYTSESGLSESGTRRQTFTCTVTKIGSITHNNFKLYHTKQNKQHRNSRKIKESFFEYSCLFIMIFSSVKHTSKKLLLSLLTIFSIHSFWHAGSFCLLRFYGVYLVLYRFWTFRQLSFICGHIFKRLASNNQ